MKSCWIWVPGPLWTWLVSVSRPKVTVLNVGSPQPPTTSTKTDPNGTQTTEQLPRTLLTIAVTQKEAQKVIVASKALDLTFGLLTSNSKVSPAPGTSTLIASLFK